MTKISIKQERPVSIIWQMVAIFLPFCWIWATYRIEKIREGTLIFFIIPATIGSFILIAIPEEGAIVLSAISAVLQIYFVHKWSTEWNDKFS